MTQLRAVIYARYSSDLQREASIEDQIRVCRDRAKQDNWQVKDIYTDVASSGSTSFRQGYQLFLEHARQERFDVVVAESLDRLSRDQEDVAALYKAMCFNRVQIVTISEGLVNELHVGLKGTMNAIFLKDLAAKTRRGMRGRVESGRSAGGICYGYSVKREYGPTGDMIRGGREIIPQQAKIIVRIFELFAAGQSPKAIARKLNGEKIPGPKGREWRDTTIRGHKERGTGILRNELYVGRLVWNRQRYLRDPTSGTRVSRTNPQSERIVEDVQALRIVSQELWDRCAERLQELADSPPAVAVKSSKFWLKRRPKGLLSGRVTCRACGGTLVTVGKDYLRCGNAHRNAGCSNSLTFRASSLERIVLEGLKEQLMKPKYVDEFCRAFTQYVEEEQGARQFENIEVESKLNKISKQIDGLVTAIAEGLRGAAVQTRLDTLESEQRTLSRQLTLRNNRPLRLPADLAAVYRSKIGQIKDSLASAEIRDQANAQVRQLVEQIIVGGTRKQPEIELIGDIAAMVGLANEKSATPEGAALQTELQRSAKVVAGARFELTTFRL